MIHSARDRPPYLLAYNNHEGGEVIMRMPYQNELYHYGILGMKWGIRRYQNPDGTLTPAGRRRYGTIENFERHMTKNQAEAHEKAKQAAIRSGQVSEVKKYSRELTPDEMKTALQRIKDEQTLDELNGHYLTIGQQRTDSIAKMAGNVKTISQSFMDTYNVVAKAHNAFRSPKLPIMGEEIKKLSIDDQVKLYNLDKTKKEDAREAEIDKILKDKGPEYFKKHPNEFTDKELKAALAKQKTINSKEWTNNNNDSSTSNQSGGKNESDAKSQTTNDNSGTGTKKKTDNGGINFKKENDSSAKETPFKLSAQSTARDASSSVSSGMRFKKDNDDSTPPADYKPSKSTTDFVKENWDNEAPFSRFESTPAYAVPGAEVDFKGLKYKKEN